MTDENKSLKKLKNKSELPEIDKAFASLVFLGWKQIDAYKVTNPNTTAQWRSINVMTSNKWANPVVKEYVQKLEEDVKGRYKGVQMQTDKNTSESSETTKRRTKEDVILELNQMIDGETDKKEKRDTMKALVEVENMKKDNDTTAEQQVKYYLPMPENEYIDYIRNRVKIDSQFADTLRSIL